MLRRVNSDGHNIFHPVSTAYHKMSPEPTLSTGLILKTQKIKLTTLIIVRRFRLP